MVTALIITNLIFNIMFGLTCGFICYGVLKKKKQQDKVQKPIYKR